MALNFQQHEPASTGRLSLIIALAVSLVCVGLYQAEGATGPLHSLQSAVEGAMVPLQRASAPLTEAVDDAGAAAAEGGVTEETYATLRQQNEQLVQQLAAAEEQRLENERLRGLLNLRDTYEITGVSGRVIGRTTDAWNQTVTLDVGSSSGVETGLTVLGPTGVVGQVISVDGGSCRVRLLTDPQSGAAAMVQSSRAEGIVRGSMDGLLYLENIGADVNVQVGDVVLTSGLGGSYTRGLIIGTVVRVTDKSNGKSVMVCVTDRGPYVRGRIIDLSYAAAQQINMNDRGVGKVDLEVVSDPSGTPLQNGQAYFVRYKDDQVGPFFAFADAAAMHEALRQGHPEAEVVLDDAGN